MQKLRGLPTPKVTGITPILMPSVRMSPSPTLAVNNNAGLDEYMWWCEDMGMAPVLAVWDGKSYGGILSGPDLEPFIDDIMNELEVSMANLGMFWSKFLPLLVSAWPPKQYLWQEACEEWTPGALEGRVHRNRQRGRLHRRLRYISRSVHADLRCHPWRIPKHHPYRVDE